MLIYQVDNGGGNTGKTPSGGIIYQGSPASSMMATIANTITYYGSDAVINQEGHSGDLYNYYWTSYSRGVDGRFLTPKNEPSWHKAYLDGYIPLRAKSIYDPCPYLYRLPSNGTWNQFGPNAGWTVWSYLGGVSWNLNTLGESWFIGLGWRNSGSSAFYYAGIDGYYRFSTPNTELNGYAFLFNSGRTVWFNSHNNVRSLGYSVRCIEGSLRSAFFSTVVDNNALGVRPILFCRKKVLAYCFRLPHT